MVVARIFFSKNRAALFWQKKKRRPPFLQFSIKIIILEKNCNMFSVPIRCTSISSNTSPHQHFKSETTLRSLQVKCQLLHDHVCNSSPMIRPLPDPVIFYPQWDQKSQCRFSLAFSAKVVQIQRFGHLITLSFIDQSHSHIAHTPP